MAERLTHNFTVDEFKCKCGCDACAMDADYMAKLQKLREVWGRPMCPTSGYRCPMHNTSQSSTGPGGPHTKGLASDWPIYGSDCYMFIHLAAELGFNKIGVNQKGAFNKRFIHLADDPPPPGHDFWLYSY